MAEPNDHDPRLDASGDGTLPSRPASLFSDVQALDSQPDIAVTIDVSTAEANQPGDADESDGDRSRIAPAATTPLEQNPAPYVEADATATAGQEQSRPQLTVAPTPRSMWDRFGSWVVGAAGVVLGLVIALLATVLDAAEQRAGLEPTGQNQLFALAGLSICVLVPIAVARRERRWTIPAVLAVVGTMLAAVTVR